MLNTVVNYFGIEITAKVTWIMLVGELIVLAIFLVIGIVALAQGKGPGFNLDPALQRRTRSPGRWSSGRSPSRCCPSSASTASRCWPRRTGAASQIGRAMVAALLLAGALFIVQTWVASLLVPDPDR